MEKRSLTFLILIAFGVSLSFSQPDKERFLFEEFQDAVVFFKDKTRSQEKINYDLISEEFWFVENGTGQLLAIANSDNIAVIKIGDRNFIVKDKVGVEVLNTTPVIHVQYRAKTRPEAAQGAYGMKSETTAISSYSSMYSSGKRVDLEGRKIIAANRFNIYWVDVKGKMKKFMNEKQFLKIYKNHDKELEKYIKTNNIDFEDLEQVIQLCVYANSL